MDLERALVLGELVKTGKRPAAAELNFAREELPSACSHFPDLELPRSVRHPGGFTVSGAPVGTFARVAMLFAGRSAYGPRYRGSPFYQAIETDLAMRIMRASFHGGAPKGAFCCKQCTLAILPALEAGTIRYFDGKALSGNVRGLIKDGAWRFNTAPNAAMLRWALGD